MDEIRQKYQAIIVKINPEEKRELVRKIECQSLDSNFWKDPKMASEKMKEMADYSSELSKIESLKKTIDEGNEVLARQIISDFENYLFFGDEFDKHNAILSIHSGQGGVEAMDWVNMLFRMYSRFIEKKGWKFEIIEQTPGEEAGLKSITIKVRGSFSYGTLKHEAGVHRLVRLSPFNANNLRQTSFALVEAMPEIEKNEKVNISEDDIEWEFYRASSHGGQNVQKVSSAVRLKHKPTGIIVTAQAERSQGQNRENALAILRGKLWLKELEERKAQEKELKGGHKTPGWGNQIRSYVLHPYKMVKDLRTNFETSKVDEVMDGELDQFISEELKLLS